MYLIRATRKRETVSRILREGLKPPVRTGSGKNYSVSDPNLLYLSVVEDLEPSLWGEYVFVIDNNYVEGKMKNGENKGFYDHSSWGDATYQKFVSKYGIQKALFFGGEDDVDRNQIITPEDIPAKALTHLLVDSAEELKGLEIPESMDRGIVKFREKALVLS